MMRHAFVAYMLGVLGLYGLSTYNGWELFAAKRGFIPAGVRQAPGGYRSYSYWRGGK
jgi:hypothetical protein